VETWVIVNDQPLSDRASNRSHRPSSQAFRDFMFSQWGAPPTDPRAAERLDSADPAAARRANLAAHFPGDRLVFPAGTLKTRSNDTDYRFRPHTAFANLTGLGMDREPDAVLVLEPVEDTDTALTAGTDTHEAVLYIRPAATRDTPEFYADSRYGEFWVGRRPTLDEVALQTGIRTAHIDALRDALAKDLGAGGLRVRVIADADAQVTELVQQVRAEAGVELVPGDDQAS
jgi:Xaa-Pro aminopeptidase